MREAAIREFPPDVTLTSMVRRDDRRSHREIPLTSANWVSHAAIRYCLNYLRRLDKLEEEGRSEIIEIRKKAIADGAYHVSAAEIGRKLIGHMLESRGKEPVKKWAAAPTHERRLRS